MALRDDVNKVLLEGHQYDDNMLGAWQRARQQRWVDRIIAARGREQTASLAQWSATHSLPNWVGQAMPDSLTGILLTSYRFALK